jgi:hypothetical protein
MLPPFRKAVRRCAAIIAVGVCTHGFAQTGTRSPFLPPQASGPASPTQGAPLEYRGYVVTSEGTQYRIYDPAKKAGTWVKLNERNPDFEVIAKQHDGDHNTLVIEHQGRTLTLAERESKVVSAGNAAMVPPQPMPAPAPATNVAPAVTQTVVVNPTPADEAKRLEAVAAEVARRRALREQATQQMTQGVQPQVAVPQVTPQPAQRPIPGNFPQNQPQFNTGATRQQPQRR